MKTRIGVIGLGRMAERAYLPVLSSLTSVELAVVMSRRAEVVERVRAQYRIPRGVTDRGEFLGQNLEAAIVLTPSPTHFELVKWLLDAGLDVLVEKPATMSSRETADLGELSKKRGRVLMVAFNRRFSPFYQRAKQRFADRPVALCVAEKHREHAVNSSLLSHYSEEVIHLIDLLRWFGGEGHAQSTRYQLRGGKLVDAASLVAFDSGGIGILAASLEAGGWLERVTLHGEGLTVQVDAFRELRILRGDTDEVVGREVAANWTSSLEVRGFLPEIEHFIQCVQTRQAPVTSAFECFKTQLLLEELASKAET